MNRSALSESTFVRPFRANPASNVVLIWLSIGASCSSLCELSPVSLQQQVARQTGSSLGRSLNGADVRPAVMKKGNVRDYSVPASLVLDEGIGSSDRYVSYIGDVPTLSRRSGKVPM